MEITITEFVNECHMTDSIKSFACIHSGDKSCATTLCENLTVCCIAKMAFCVT